MRDIDVRHLGIPLVICCHVIDDVIVDPGPESTMDTLLAELGDWQPAKILLTHIHLDHAGAAGALAQRWPDAEVWVHERGARHMLDPSRLMASAARIYGADMDRLWGDMHPVPEDRLRVLSGGGVGGRIGPSAIRQPATSPTIAVPVGSWRYETWCHACPGVYATRHGPIVSPPDRTRSRSSGTGCMSPQRRFMSSP